MAKLDYMPHQHIIDGLKGIIDFYEWNGIPVARKWPRKARQPGTPRQVRLWDAFRYINQLWASLPAFITQQYTAHARPTSLTGKDHLVQAYMKGVLTPDPPYPLPYDSLTFQFWALLTLLVCHNRTSLFVRAFTDIPVYIMLFWTDIPPLLITSWPERRGVPHKSIVWKYPPEWNRILPNEPGWKRIHTFDWHDMLPDTPYWYVFTSLPLVYGPASHSGPYKFLTPPEFYPALIFTERWTS